MVQTSTEIRISLMADRPGENLALRLHHCEYVTLRRAYPSLSAAQAAASKRRPRINTIAVFWASDEYAVPADAVIANDYATMLL
jgi:hypothetical protein